MSRKLIIDHGDDIHRLSDENLPLLLLDNQQFPFAWGGIESAGEQVAAVIASSGDYFFIQLHHEQQSVYINNEKLNQSQWLKSGDIIEINHRLHFLWTVKTDLASLKLLTNYQPVIAPPTPPIYHQEKAHTEVNVDTQPKCMTRNYAVFFTTVVLTLLAIISILLIFSLPLTITIRPGVDEIHLDGRIPALKINQRWLALPGNYQLNASKAGYFPLQTEIDLERGKNGDFSFELKEIPGKIYIQTQPPVSFDVLKLDQFLPILDNAIHLKQGKHLITLVTERYLPELLELDVEGLGKTQFVQLALKPAWADVMITSVPDHAKININGRYMGRSPYQTTLVQGIHELGLELEGYERKQLTANISAGEKMDLTVGLSPLGGMLEIHSQPEDAQVYIADTLMGNTPLKVKLAADTKTQIEIRKSGYQSLQISKKLTSDSSERTVVKLKRSSSPKPEKTDNSIQLPPDESTPIVQSKLNAPLGNKMILFDVNTDFTMGASRREAGRRANERMHTVRLTRAFYLSSKEITNAQFKKYQPQHDSGSFNSAHLNDNQQPVVNVSWEAAVRFCNWLSRQAGLPEFYQEKNGKLVANPALNTGYRLPTEAEWAYAARAHGRSELLKYPWSGNFPPQTVTGNFADSQIADAIADTLKGYDDGYRVSAPVGSFKSDKNGLFDIGGNVSEWVHDYYSIGGNTDTKSATNPLGPANGHHHVIRGASWRNGNITELRLSHRDYSAKSRADLGFRIARYAN